MTRDEYYADLLQFTPGEVWEKMFRRILANYKRRFWRWYLEPGYRDLAWADAMAQADGSSRDFIRWRLGR